MKTIFVKGIPVRIFWTGVVEVVTQDHAQALAILSYMNEEGMLELDFLATHFVS